MKSEKDIREMSKKIKELAGTRQLENGLLLESVGIIDALDWVIGEGAIAFLPSFISDCESRPMKEKK